MSLRRRPLIKLVAVGSKNQGELRVSLMSQKNNAHAAFWILDFGLTKPD
jgi:hypothetical protein